MLLTLFEVSPFQKASHKSPQIIPSSLPAFSRGKPGLDWLDMWMNETFCVCWKNEKEDIYLQHVYPLSCFSLSNQHCQSILLCAALLLSPHFMSGDARGHLCDGGRQKCVGRQKAICSEKEDQAQDFMCDILKHSDVLQGWRVQLQTVATEAQFIAMRWINLVLKMSGEMSAYYEALTFLQLKSHLRNLVTCWKRNSLTENSDCPSILTVQPFGFHNK